jgi:fructoselysine 3-epimerase
MPTLSTDQLIGANFSFQHYRFEHVAEVLRDFGFRELELWGIGQHLDLFTADDARVQHVQQVLADNGLAVWCFTPEQVLYPINIASGDDQMRRASVDRFRRAADICASLGARYLFLTSGRGFEDEPAHAAWQRSVESLREITAHAAEQGVRCLLEPLQRVETNVLLDAAGVRRMLDEVGADNMDVVLDTVAMAVAGDTVTDYVKHFGERLAHVQLVDGTPAGHLVWGDGALPLGDYLEQLAEYGYQGKVTFEPFGEGSYALDPVTAWRRCLDGARPYFDAGRVAR